MVRHAGLGSSCVERVAARLCRCRQLAHDIEPHGIAERMEHELQRHLLDRGMFEPSHESDVPQAIVAGYCTMEFERS